MFCFQPSVPQNGDFLKSSAPLQYSQPPATGRTLGFGDASSVSYTPSMTERSVPASKPSAHISHPQQPLQQQQAQTHQMFPHPYSPFNYVNYGMRADDPYSAALLQYPLNGMNVDFSSLISANNPISQSGHGQPIQGTQHRTDSHNMVDNMKYQNQQNTRDQTQQPSNVAPPPGFANSANFMAQPQISSLFMQPQYPHMPFSYMMPNVGNAGRQMYPEEERKGYDKIGGAKQQAQATPPPHYHNGGNYMNINKKPYNWNN